MYLDLAPRTFLKAILELGLQSLGEAVIHINGLQTWHEGLILDPGQDPNGQFLGICCGMLLGLIINDTAYGIPLDQIVYYIEGDFHIIMRFDARLERLGELASHGSSASFSWGVGSQHLAVNFKDITISNFLRSKSFYPLYKGMFRGNPVVVKILLDSDFSPRNSDELLEVSERVTGALKNEVLKMSSLKHQSIVSFMAVCNSPPCVVTPWAVGGSLDKLLESAPADPSIFPFSRRMESALEIAHGLRYLHSGGQSPVVHGHLTPSAVLLTSSSADPKLSCQIDMSISWVAVSTSSSIGRHHDIRWMAPEQLMGECGPEADVFAFGTICWQLLTLEHPWGRKKSWIVSGIDISELASRLS